MDDAAWLQNLSRTAPGRQLSEHLKCVDYVIKNANRFECPVQEVCTFRRVFCHAFSMDDRAFGLPRPLPKYIAIVNLSGFRTILYSSRNSLIRLLCLVGPVMSGRVIQNVEEVLQYASEHDTSVLCCLSLPWQTGVNQVHWEVRTFEKTEGGGVRDGVRSFSYTNEDVRTCASTIDTDVCDVRQTKREVMAMLDNYTASNLDAYPDTHSDDIDVGDDCSAEKLSRLKIVVGAVKADRSRLISEMESIREDKQSCLAEAKRQAHIKMLELTKETQQIEATMRERMNETELQNKMLGEQNLALGRAKAEAERAKAESELLQEQQLNKAVSKASLLEISHKAATDKLSALQKTTRREREQLSRAHTKEVEGLERRLSDETVARRTAELRCEHISVDQSKLNEVCAKLRAEKQALGFESLSIRKSRLAMKCALAVACQKHATLVSKFQSVESCSLELKQMVDQKQANAASVDLRIASLETDLKEAREQIEEAAKKAESRVQEACSEADQAKRRFVEVKKECAEMKRLLAEAKKPADQVAPLPAERPKSETVSVSMNTEPQQESEELTKMRIEIATLHDQKDVLQKKLSKAAKSERSVRPSTDSDSTPCGDPAIEALVDQVHLSMKNLVNIARSGHTHKSAAEQLWLEVQMMKQAPSNDAMANASGWAAYNVYNGNAHGPQPHWFRS